MSLINDALKRASQTKPPLLPTPEPECPLRPVEYRRSVRWPLFLLPILLIAVVLAGWFFLRGLNVHRALQASGASVSVAAREPLTESAPSNAPARAGKGANQPSNPPSTPRVPASAAASNQARVDPATNASGSNDLPSASTVPAPATFPALRLQGIFYRPTKPSVLINAKTLPIGGKVAGAQVIAITRDSVTLEWNGETKVLTLE